MPLNIGGIRIKSIIRFYFLISFIVVSMISYCSETVNDDKNVVVHRMTANTSIREVTYLVEKCSFLIETNAWVDKRLEPWDAGLKYAIPSAEQWHKRVMSLQWQPPTNAGFICYKGKEGYPDAIFTTWKMDVYNSVSIQTANKLFIIVTIPNDDKIGSSVEVKREYARQLCGQLFANCATRMTGQGEKRTITNLASRISDRLAASSNTVNVKNKEYVFGSSMHNDQLRSKAYSVEEVSQLKELDNTYDVDKWMASKFRDHYWFGNIVWWSYCDKVVFCVYKLDNGSVDRRDPSLEIGWFSPSTRFRK